MITQEELVTAFPEFSDEDSFPKPTVDFWITQAYASLDAGVLDAQLDLAAMLFVAHNISLGAREISTAEAGGVPGQTVGVQASKSVGSASVSYDVGSTGFTNAGFWNATSYGRRLYGMVRAFAAGGFYRQGDAFARARLGRWG